MQLTSGEEKNRPNKTAGFKWLALMAWRDSRRNRSRLLLFISSVILGIAALVAIYSLGDNLRSEIDKQAASLLGADIQLSTNKPFSPEMKKMIDSLGDKRSEERRFASMVYFIKSGGSRLTQIRALGGDFPYYGELETEPASAGRSFKKGTYALVDQTLMLQYNAKVGDSIKVGNLTFSIAGSLTKAPGQTGLSTTVAPPVYIPLNYLQQTGLVQRGSSINYRFYINYNKPVDIQKVVSAIEPRLEAEDINYDTVESQKEDTNRSFSDLNRFLSLVGFIALLLGCIGVASAIHIYVREKINDIAILRCLGAKASQAFLIYLLQILGIGIIGAIIGAALGTIIQLFLPGIIKDFLPVDVTPAISISAIIQGIILGIVISVLFGLLPLVSIRNISPLNVLRASYENDKPKRDVVKWIVYALILVFIFVFSNLQMKNSRQAVTFTVSIVVAFLVLTAIASLLIWAIRKFFPASFRYTWRQGLANLYRPNNQTIILIVSIGLGTAFICTLIFIQTLLLKRVDLSSGKNQPNMVLFDVQPAQTQALVDLAKQQRVPVNSVVPIVNMRLEKVNDFTESDAKKDTTIGVSARIFKREYRVTYRDTLSSSETIAAGNWIGTSNYPSGPVNISIEQGFAKRGKIKLGDTLTFNVQGADIPTVVSSIREVNWNRIQTNFIIVFPKGVLEDAPQFKVLLTHLPSTEASAHFQQAVVQQFPNVSIIDLGLVLQVLDDLLSKIGFVIRFMASFSILTGLVVLIASVLLSKYQRLQESVLLRTLGASRRQIFSITALEYFFLGTLAAITGILLASIAGWALAKYTFEIEFKPNFLPIAVVFVLVCLLTVIIGLINSRSVLTRPPLEVLRQEVR